MGLPGGVLSKGQAGTTRSEIDMTQSDALRAIINEAASARSALCENELVIRLDNILALARAALEEQEPDEMPQSSTGASETIGHRQS